METRLAVAMSEAEMVAVNWLPLPNVVGRGLPFQRIVAPSTNPAPFTTRGNAGPPGTIAPGTVGLFKKGTGLFCATIGEQNDVRRKVKIAAATMARMSASHSGANGFGNKRTLAHGLERGARSERPGLCGLTRN
jgi:hypothetical protein